MVVLTEMNKSVLLFGHRASSLLFYLGDTRLWVKQEATLFSLSCRQSCSSCWPGMFLSGFWQLFHISAERDFVYCCLETFRPILFGERAGSAPGSVHVLLWHIPQGWFKAVTLGESSSWDQELNLTHPHAEHYFGVIKLPLLRHLGSELV